MYTVAFPPQNSHTTPEEVLTALTVQTLHGGPSISGKMRSRVALDLGIPPLDPNIHKVHSTYIGEGTRLVQLLLLPQQQHADAPWINNYLGIDLQSCRDKERYGTQLPIALDRLWRWSLGEIDGQDGEASELIACLGRILTWLSHYDEATNTRFAQVVYTALDDMLSKIFSWRNAERSLAIRMSSKYLWLFWAAIELSFRLSFVLGNSPDAQSSMNKYVDQTLDALLQNGFSGVQEDLNAAAPDCAIQSNVVNVWICVIQLLQSATLGPSLWARITSILSNAEWVPRSPFERSEEAWTAAYVITALSQFTVSGTISSFPLLPANWPLVSLAVSIINTSAYGDDKFDPRVLRKRDLFLRGLLARCLILSTRWGWKLTESVELLNNLCEIFRSRQFSGLRGESHEFPLFLTEPEGLSLVDCFDARDSGHDLFLKLVIRAVHDLRTYASPEIALKQTRKLISIMLPVSSVQFTSATPPSKRNLSKLYNRYASVLVAAYLEQPSPDAFCRRVQQARLYSDFEIADWQSRRAIIEAIMRFGLEAVRRGEAISTIISWQSMVFERLLIEAQELEVKSNVENISGFEYREQLEFCIQMIFGSTRLIFQRFSGSDSVLPHRRFPEPAMLHSGARIVKFHPLY